MDSKDARTEVARVIAALRDVAALDLAAVARAIDRVPREVPASGFRGRGWVLDGPAGVFAEATFQARGDNAAFVIASLEIEAAVVVEPGDVEPLLADLPFQFAPAHASFSDGPRMTGVDYSFAAPAGLLYLPFRHPPDEAFGRAALERNMDGILDGRRPRSARLASISLTTRTREFDPSFTLRRMRAWARSGEPWGS